MSINFKLNHPVISFPVVKKNNSQSQNKIPNTPIPCSVHPLTSSQSYNGHHIHNNNDDDHSATNSSDNDNVHIPLVHTTTTTTDSPPIIKFHTKNQRQNKIPNNNNNIIVDCCISLFSHRSHQQSTFHKREAITWGSRISCSLVLLPLVFFFARSDDSLLLPNNNHNSNASFINSNPVVVHPSGVGVGVRIASCIYLAIMPLTSYFLLSFTYVYSANKNMTMTLRMITCFLCAFSLLLGNIAAVLFLLTQRQMITTTTTTTFSYLNLAFLCLSSSFTIGCIQLLLLMRKTSALRVMFCTATAVSVITLCILAFQTSNTLTGRRFYQTAAFPFVLLFFETTRSHG